MTFEIQRLRRDTPNRRDNGQPAVQGLGQTASACKLKLWYAYRRRCGSSVSIISSIRSRGDGQDGRTAPSTGVEVEPTFEHPLTSVHNLPSGLILDATRPWTGASHKEASLFLFPYDGGRCWWLCSEQRISVVSSLCPKQISNRRNSVLSSWATEHSYIRSWTAADAWYREVDCYGVTAV
ncbi:hypothetical protein DOTSEDRAFT_75890 [Dothistroma septosporum NZE10]|uniref:Uncharacterized protein n=1 Tax=Dothistroma septosporum (strain NZE10 / CBS 128990) TaxID=675120 RepID=N1PBY7_DOTSN|nr:hypothetical protein DOTSEDRAFT_75890 [Dothistroma septosporum NZE10]